MTTRLAESVVRLCRVLAVQHVASWYGHDWDAVKALNKAALATSLLPVDLSQVTVIALDEFALRKGPPLCDHHRGSHPKARPLGGPGPRPRGHPPLLPATWARGLPAPPGVVMDMNPAYEEEVRSQAPQAEIVYDLFHVVAKYGREVIDRVWVGEANRWRHQPKARKVIKGARWLLLRTTRTSEPKIG